MTSLINQTLDPISLHINDIILRQYKDITHRLIPITSSDNKGYYVMTELLAPKSVFCTSNKITDSNGKNHYINKFRLTVPKYTIENVNEININNETNIENESLNNNISNVNTTSESSTDFDIENVNEIDINNETNISNEIDINNETNISNEIDINNETDISNENEIIDDTLTLIHQSVHINDKLNKFQRGFTDRIRYMMFIPQYNDKKSFGLKIRTIKINNIVKYKNIIEYQNKKNNFSYNVIKQVLMNCCCRLLLKINYIMISNTNVVLNIRLVRILPDNLDRLSQSTKLYIMGELNALSCKNIEKYRKLDRSYSDDYDQSKMYHRTQSKTDTKNELMKLFNIPKTISTTKSRNANVYKNNTSVKRKQTTNVY